MEYISLRNAVVLALAQIGVIVFGTLGAGACYKWYTSIGLTPHSSTAFVAEYGFLALVLPVAWISYSVWCMKQSLGEAFPQQTAFVSGIVLLLLLLVVVLKAVVFPWLATVFRPHGLGARFPLEERPRVCRADHLALHRFHEPTKLRRKAGEIRTTSSGVG